MERLPLELWEIIFAHIDDLQLARLTRVAKLWNHNLSADMFWKKRTEEAFGPQQRVTQGKWKVRFGREYKALMYDTQRMKPPPVFPIRSLVLGEIFAAVVLTIWAVVLPNLALDFLSSPLPAVIAWVGMKGFKKAGVKIDRSVPRFLSLRTYVVSAFVVIQALLAWQLSPAACSTAVVTGYVLMCNAFLIEGITDSQAELRLLYMLAQWKLMASSSMLQVYLFLFSPLDYFSQQAFTRNLFLLATATKILKPVYLTGPVLPRLLKEQCFADGAQTEQAAISCASVQSGILVSLSNGATFIGAPIMGLMSDTLGRRAFLMVSAAALSLDLISLALAPTVGLLYITRPLFGFFNAGFAISTAYCADMVGPANRGRAFGILGVSFGIALACGPLLTGWMAKYFAVRVALLVVGIIAATNVALGFFLRETRPRTNPPARIAWDKAVPLRSFGLLRHSNVAMAFTAVFLLKYIADEGIIDTFPLYLDYKFSWSPLQVGVFASLLGLSLALAQGLLVPFLHLLYTERQAIILALILATVAGLMYAMANEGWQLYIIIVFRSISLISAPLLQAEIANEFSANTLGELLGLVTSLRNLSASFGPLMFNWLFAYFISDKAPMLIPNVVFYVSAACSMLATMLAVATVLRSKEPAAKASEERAPETVELTSVDANGGEGSDATL